MSERDDPPRLVDPASGAPAALGELFRSARADLPSKAELSLLSERVDAAVRRAPPPLTRASRLGPKAALGIGAGLVGLAVGVWLLTARSEAPRPAVVPAAPSAATLTAPAPPVPLAGPRSEPERAAEPAATAPTAAPLPEPAPAAPSARAARGASEAALLEAARAALATNPARALALTREHARRFPRGILAQEREVIAIEALRRAGQSRAAEERATDFQREYPGSPHRRSVGSKAP